MASKYFGIGVGLGIGLIFLWMRLYKRKEYYTIYKREI